MWYCCWPVCSKSLLRPISRPMRPFSKRLLRHQTHFQLGFVDWSQSGPRATLRACQQNALLTSQLAKQVGCDEWPAWLAGFLTPLGWLAMVAANQGETSDCPDLSHHRETARQRDAWGYDPTAIARRMCRAWRLPTWLSAIVGHLGLPAGIAAKLGARPSCSPSCSWRRTFCNPTVTAWAWRSVRQRLICSMSFEPGCG